MYVLTIRDGLQTRHVGPYITPQDAAQDVDRVVALHGDRVHWQIHELEPPTGRLVGPEATERRNATAA